MSLPPGTEDISYKNHRLEVRHFGPGWRVFIYGPGSILAFSEIPHSRSKDEREKVIDEAKAIIDQHLSKKPGR
jgi:hypothetical protein